MKITVAFLFFVENEKQLIFKLLDSITFEQSKVEKCDTHPSEILLLNSKPNFK